MPAPKRGPRLGAGPKHQKLLLASQATELFRHGRIKTTETKAKTLRPYAERLITKAKQGDLHARRQVLSKLRDRDVVAYLFEDVAPRFADRDGGYTRILKLGPRPGDSAPMAIIELVDRGEGSGEEAIEESRGNRSRGLFGRRRKPKAAAPAMDDQLDLDDDTSDDTSEDTSEDTSADVGADEGLQAQVPDDTPAQEPSAPDDLGAGNPVGPEDTPDAGKASGKDADKS